MSEIGAASPFVSAGSGGLSSPKDLTLGPDGNLYVATGNNSVMRYDGSTGQLIGTFVAAGSGGLSGPYGLAFGPDGNLYVSNRGTNNSILRFNGTTGAFIDSFVAGASGGLAGPDGIAFGADGNLYVVSSGTSSILRFQGPSGASPGAPLPAKLQRGANFVATGSGGLSNPADLVFGPDGNLYISSQILPVGTSKQAVLKFNGTTGAFISTYVAPGAGGLIDPRGLAFDQEGRLYVADIGISAIHRYGNAGQYLDDPVVIGDPAVVSPVGLVFDAQGRLLIASRDSNAISRYDQGVTVTVSQASPTPVSVGYATTDNSATAGIDYIPQSGSITFVAGQTTRLILLSAHNDARVDGSETFYVDLSNPTGDATVAAGRAVVTIVDGDTRTWSPADPMITGRTGFTATLLTNGKVLVAGGAVLSDPSYSLSSAELYDPTTNRWSLAAPMATPRSGATATLLSNGKVLVAGGVDTSADQYLSSAELYDPLSNTWSSARSMAHPRIAQTATLLANGKVLVAGGGPQTLSSAELYDPAKNTWSAAGSMAIARLAGTAMLLGNGKVLVVGGFDAAGQSVADAELYDAITNRWSSAGSLATARGDHTATLLNNGKVLVAGGNDSVTGASYALPTAELYDPTTNTWSAAASMATPRQEHTATLLINGKVLVAGGRDYGANINAPLSSAELYDPVNNTWSSVSSMLFQTIGPTATLLANGKVLVAGGLGPVYYDLASAELYDPGLPSQLADPSQSTLAVTPASIPLGGTAQITLTAKDSSGKPLASGGLPFSFGFATGTGTITNLIDHDDGTYTGTFTATGVGSFTITATLNGEAITSTLPTVTVTPAVPVAQLAITNLNPSSVTAGDVVRFTVTAEDSTGTPLAGYAGTVHFASSDSAAVLPSDYTFTLADEGTHIFSATLNTAGTQSLTATDNKTASVTGSLTGILVKLPAMAGMWLIAAGMATPRSQFQATLLSNGKVLVTGGIDDNQKFLSSAELYDPVSNTWSSAGSMSTPRKSHTATLLKNGEVLVAGGQAAFGSSLASAELYDPATNSWSLAGSMASTRCNQTATLLSDGSVLVTGGIDTNFHVLASAELYNPVTNSWSPAGSMTAARVNHTATLLGNGQVLVTGGSDANFDVLSSAELYDPATNTWSAAVSMAETRFSHTATLLGSGSVLVAGGENLGVTSSAELYDPTNNTWSSAGSMILPRVQHTATLLSNGLVLVVGGDRDDIGTGILPSAELYDPLTNAWSPAGSMTTARDSQTAILLNSGLVLVAGGEDSNVLSSAELYSPAKVSASQSTITVTPPNLPLGGTATITLTAKDFVGMPLTSGGLTFSFGLATGTGTITNLTDNNDGTYTATFTATSVGSVTITATLDGQPITSILPTITVTQTPTKYVISNLSATSLTAGGTVTFTVTAEDANGKAVPSYTGTVQLTSMDAHAVTAGNGLPTSYTFVPSDNGAHSFTVMLATAGSQTITATDQANNDLTATTSPVTVTAGSFPVNSWSAPRARTRSRQVVRSYLLRRHPTRSAIRSSITADRPASPSAPARPIPRATCPSPAR
jgi:N-acetylneuraminic acid mutarotase/sugar lactone lactonase YvrE